jgi:hypothetical protein
LNDINEARRGTIFKPAELHDVYYYYQTIHKQNLPNTNSLKKVEKYVRRFDMAIENG